MAGTKTIRFRVEDLIFEYDEDKDRINHEKHGISLKNASLVFFDYDRIEFYDEEHSDINEDRFNIIGSASPIGTDEKGPLLFVVYTKRSFYTEGADKIEVNRIISARKASGFEKGIYYGKYN